MNPAFALDRHIVHQHFTQAASSYGANAVLYAEVARRLMDRLNWMRVQLDTIVDMGSGTGFVFDSLAENAARSQLIAIDINNSMLQQQKPNVQCIQANAEQLPLAAGSVDLVVMNQLLHWCDEPMLVLKEVKRVVRPNGLILFSSLGTQTLPELRSSFAAAGSTHEHVHSFFDMHDLGDALVSAGFADPVMESETFTLRYSKIEKLIEDLRAVGETNALSQRQRGLMGKQTWQKMLQHYEQYRIADTLPATYEVIYGHAWVPEPRQFVDSETKQVKVPIQTIKRKN